MNKNTRTRHIAESPVGGDVDRRSFLKLTGAGLVAALPISAAPWRARQQLNQRKASSGRHTE